MATYLGEIKYLKNWNSKLNCEYHTTIRLNIEKYHVGMLYSIMKDGEFCYYAEVVYLEKYTIHTLPNSICFTDAGLSKEDTIKQLKELYKHHTNIDWNTQPLYVVTIKRNGNQL